MFKHIGWRDSSLAAALALLAVIVSVTGFYAVGSLMTERGGFDVWFSADVPRVYSNMLTTFGNHYRTSVHPIFSVLVHPITTILQILTGWTDATIVMVVFAAFSAISIVLLYAFLRLMSLPAGAAALFTLLYISSATFIYWSGIPETYLPASLSIILMLLLLAMGQRAGWLWWVIGSAGTLSITITNAMFGFVATVVTWPWRGVVRIILVATLLVMAASVAQKLIYNRAQLFFDPRSLIDELRYTPISDDAPDFEWTPAANIHALLVTTIVAPTPEIGRSPTGRNPVIIDNQMRTVLDRGPVGIAAGASWVALLAIGLWGAARARRVGLGLLLSLAGQAVLHLIYGYPTFLYAMHVAPVLIGIAACAWYTPLRHYALGLAAATVLLGGITNIETMREAVDLAHAVMAEKAANR